MNIHRSAHVHDTRREQAKEATTRSGATASTRRDTPKGRKTKSPFCVVLTTYHLTGNHHENTVKHSNLKLCPNVTHMEQNGNSKGTGNRRKNKRRHKELRRGSKHCNFNFSNECIIFRQRLFFMTFFSHFLIFHLLSRACGADQMCAQ